MITEQQVKDILTKEQLTFDGKCKKIVEVANYPVNDSLQLHDVARTVAFSIIEWCFDEKKEEPNFISDSLLSFAEIAKQRLAEEIKNIIKCTPIDTKDKDRLFKEIDAL